jgi:ankyrin repeat protein/uncharacterized protein YecT (DUF1311 family)
MAGRYSEANPGTRCLIPPTCFYALRTLAAPMRRARSLIALGVALLLLAAAPPAARAETAAEHLLALVESKDLDQIGAYLAQPGVAIDDRPGGKSMLDFAAERNLVDVVQYLLDHGADVDGHSQSREDKIVGRPGVTALCRAAYFNAVDAMELLLKHDAAVNSPRGTQSPLICAAFQGNLKAAQILVEHGADLNHEYGPHQTPLSEAIMKGHVDVAKYLVSLGATSSPGDVNSAAMAGSPDLVSLALTLKPEQKMLDAALLSAVGNVHIDEATRQVMIQMLLAHGAEPDSPQNGFPHGVVSNAATADTAAFLLDHGGNSQSKLTGYELASAFVCTEANKDHLAMLKMLVSRGMDFRAPGSAQRNPIGCAAGTGQIDVIDFLVQHGANVGWPDFAGYTPIFQATTQAVIEDLLKHGADLDGPGQKWQKDGTLLPMPQLTPLSSAIASNQWGKAALLVSMGADVRTQEPSLLTEVALKGPPEMLSTLLDHGVDINTKSPAGETALMAVVRSRERDKVQLLIDHGADVNVQSNVGLTPLHLAVEGGDVDLVKLLLAHGAARNTSDGGGVTPLAEARTTELRQLVAIGAAARVTDGTSERDRADCKAALATDNQATHRESASASPAVREPGEDWDYLDQVAGDALEISIGERGYLLAISNNAGYLAHVDTDGVERIVCEYGPDSSKGGLLRALTEYERLQERAARDSTSISLESLKMQGVRGAAAILETSRRPRNAVPLELNSDENLLGEAAQSHRDDILAYYLEHGVDANLPSRDRSSATGVYSVPGQPPPLFTAVKYGSDHSVELLLAHGATPDAAEPPPQTGPEWVVSPALAVAIINRSQFVVEDLLSHGASPDMPSGHGFPPGVGIYAGFHQVLGGQLDQWVTNWLYQPRYQGPDVVANADVVFRHGASPDPWLYSVLSHLQLRATANHRQLPESVRKGISTAPESEQARQVAEGIRATYPAISDLLTVALRYRDTPPCDESTAPDVLKYCLPKSLMTANGDLNARFARLLELPGTDVAAVRDTERRWIRERDKACRVTELNGVSQSGWIAYVLSDPVKANCVLRYFRERVSALPVAIGAK